MRPILLLFQLIFVGLWCNAQTSRSALKKNFFRTNTTIQIEGSIKNFDTTVNMSFISFRTFDLHGFYKDTNVLPTKSGAFSALLFQPSISDIQMKYREHWTSIFPIEEKVQLEINQVLWDKRERGCVNLSGSGKRLTELMISFLEDFKEASFKSVEWSDETKSDEEVANSRVEQMKAEIDYLNQYVSKNKIRNADFFNWARNEILCNAGLEILHNSFYAGRKKLTDSQLAKILNDMPMNDPTAYNNSAFYGLLSSWTMDLIFIINLNPMYKDAIMSNGMDAIPLYLQKIDTYSKGLNRQLMYYNMFFMQSPKRNAAYLPNFLTVIQHPRLKKSFLEEKENILNAKPFEPYDLMKKLTQYKIDDSLKARLISLLNSEKGKFVFIDFWGDWCMPCMREMPLYPKLISEFKDDPITFLFLSTKTNETKALEIKNKYGINATFYSLNEAEEKIMNNVLSFSSYPRHFLLNKNGFVVEEAIHRISNTDTVDKIRKQLSKKE